MSTLWWKRAFLVGVCCLCGLGLAGCNPAESVSDQGGEPTAEMEVPTAVTQSRDAAIDFVRAAAPICVPPEGVAWRVSKPENTATEGAHVYRFVNGDCTVTVAYPDPPPPEAIYYVSLLNSTTDFCWQAFVDAAGEIVSSGYEAVSPEAVNPAVTYCEAQGYQYQIVTKPDGEPCGACVFDDGTACNAWEYFYGECSPGENPLP